MKKTYAILTSILALLVLTCAIGTGTMYYINKNTNKPQVSFETTQLWPGTTKPITTTEATVPTTIVPSTEATTVPQITTINISMLGDCMIASYKGESNSGNLNWTAKNKEPEYFLEKVQDIIGKDDFTIANCETTITDSSLKETYKDYSPAYWYKGPSSNLKIFNAGSVEIAGVANNHSNDYGEQGYSDTKNALKKYNILCATSDSPIYFEKEGKTIGLYCCGLWSSYHTANIKEKVSKMKDKCDFIIVYFHGGTERKHSPEKWKVEACHSIIDAGADLVVGAHPHVLQPLERYNGKLIVYSIGNFLYGGSWHPENRTIILNFDVTFEEGKSRGEIKEKIIPCYVYTGSSNNWQPTPVKKDEPAYSQILDFMHEKRDLPY